MPNVVKPVISPPQRTDLQSNSIVRSNSVDGEDIGLPPTLEASAELQFAYEYFNAQLFDSKLPNCIITYTRKKKVLGHFCADRFQRVGGELWPELALNPVHLALRDDRDSLSTLVHEQAHVGRHYFGPLNRRGGRGTNGYHDKPWGDLMRRIGLMPSNTGKPGGKCTGYQMTHYIIDGGPFDLACNSLLENGFRINWHDRIRLPNANGDGDGDGDGADNPSALPKKDRIKFTCAACGLNAWAKPSARLSCQACIQPLLPNIRTNDHA